MKKTFDCVEMKNECAKKVRQLIGSVSIKQELSFWKKRAEALKGNVHIGVHHYFCVNGILNQVELSLENGS